MFINYSSYGNTHINIHQTIAQIVQLNIVTRPFNMTCSLLVLLLMAIVNNYYGINYCLLWNDFG